jgi:hypothetical protein
MARRVKSRGIFRMESSYLNAQQKKLGIRIL